MTQGELKKVLEENLAPLIEMDGGTLFWVQGDLTSTRLHLTGKFSGCPGNYLVERVLIQPLLEQFGPEAALTVTSGPLIPEGAVQILAKLKP